MPQLKFQPVPNHPNIQVHDHRDGMQFQAVIHDNTAILTGKFPHPDAAAGLPDQSLTVTVTPKAGDQVVLMSLGDLWDDAKALIGFGVKLLEGVTPPKAPPDKGGGNQGGGNQSGGSNVVVNGNNNTVIIYR